MQSRKGMVLSNYRTLSNVKHWALGSSEKASKRNAQGVFGDGNDGMTMSRAMIKIRAWLQGVLCEYCYVYECVC